MSENINEEESNELEFICLDEADDNAIIIDEDDDTLLLDSVDIDKQPQNEIHKNQLINLQEVDLYDDYCLIHPSINEYFDEIEINGQPEYLEGEIVKFPSLENLLYDIKQHDDMRMIELKSITFTQFIEDFYDIMSDVSILHIETSFDKSEDEDLIMKGEAKIIYNSRLAAIMAYERIKGPSNYLLKCLNKLESKTYTAIDQTNISENWIDRILIIKNLGETPDLELCQTFFPNTQIILRKDALNEKLKGQAIVICESVEKAEEYLQRCHQDKIKINKKLIIVQKWIQNISYYKEYLRLGDRLFVLEQIEKNKGLIVKAGEKEWLINRIKWLLDILHKDNKSRFDLNLSTPSLDQLRNINILKKYTLSEGENYIIKLLSVYKQKEINKVLNKDEFVKKEVKSYVETARNKRSWRGRQSNIGYGNHQTTKKFHGDISSVHQKRPYSHQRAGILGAAPLPKMPRNEEPPSLFDINVLGSNGYASKCNEVRFKGYGDRDVINYHNYEDDILTKYQYERNTIHRGAYARRSHNFRNNVFHGRIPKKRRFIGGDNATNQASNIDIKNSKNNEKTSFSHNISAKNHEEDPVSKLLFLSKIIADRLGNE